MERIKSLIRDKEIVLGIGLFVYFFLLLLGVIIPVLRIGDQTGFSIAFIYRSIIFILFFIFIIIAFYKKHRSINYVFGIVLLIFFLSNILAIFIPFNSANISLLEKFMAILYLVSLIFTIFAFFEVLPSIFSKRSLVTILVLVMVAMGICCLYSLIKEWKDIIQAFTAKGEDAHFHQIHSFFDNKNTYGVMVFVALVANIILYRFYRRKWLFIPLIFFFINLIISRCKTSIIAAIFLFLIVFIYLFIKSFKKHQIRNILILSLLVYGIFAFFFIVYTPVIYESNSFLSNLSNYFREAFIGQSIRTIEARIAYLREGAGIFLNPRIILGYGEHICLNYANSGPYHLGPVDNVILYNLLAGGIFKTVLYFYCYYLIIKKLLLLKKFQVNQLYRVTLWGIVISVFMNGLMESYQILGSNHLSFVFLIFSSLAIDVELRSISNREIFNVSQSSVVNSKTNV